MKKLLFSFALLAALVGCSDSEDGPVTPQGGNTDEIPAASFTIEATPGISLAWENGTAVSVFRSKTNEKFVYSAETSVFKKEDNLEKSDALGNVYGIHPYKGANRIEGEGKVKLSFPTDQAYVAGGISLANTPLVAVSANSTSTEMEFKQVAGIACVKLYGTAAIKSVEIKGANGESLAGTAEATCGADSEPNLSVVALKSDKVTLTAAEAVTLGTTAEEATPFYVLIPPTTFSQGYQITIVDSYDNVIRKNFKVDEETPAVTVGRNQIVELASLEIAEKLPLQTILDVQFNTDGSATDAGKYEFTVERVGDIKTYLYVYDHPQFDANNIARFGHIAHNEAGKKHDYYKIDYQAAEEFKATLADGFTWETVTYSTAYSYDWWSCPVGSDAFRVYRKGHLDGNEMLFNINSDGAWWPYNANAQVYTTSTVYDQEGYIHTVFIYDADNQTVSVYKNGLLVGMAENVTEFKTGRWLTIGGYVESEGNDLFMQWNGEVALVKMYDQPITAEEVAAKYNALKLPQAPAQPAAPAISTPLFDVKFKEDRTAENVGSMSSLVPTYYPNNETSVVNVDGYGYVANFNLPIHNGTYGDGFYRIDYTDNEEFKSKLADGFTFEVLCVSNFDQGYFWMRPASSNKWGFMLQDANPGDPKRWRTYANHGDNRWSEGEGLIFQAGGYHVYWGNGNNYWPGTEKDTSFTHIVYIYNAEAKEFCTYADGHFNGGKPIQNFDVGSMFHINGIPYIRGIEMAHGWNGKVATVRVYDEAFTQDQVIERFNALKPTIEKLNTIIQ